MLLSQRKPGTHLAGAWEFPGGKVEPGEDPREALVRELREEVGIEAVVTEVVDVTFFRYEDLVADLPAAMRTLAVFAGLELDDATITTIAASMHVDAMRQKNPQHVRTGGSGGFRELLTPAQQERALALVGPTLRELGYAV